MGSSSMFGSFTQNESLVDFGSGIYQNDNLNAFDFPILNATESHGIQINPTEYPQTVPDVVTDVYQINRNYSDRSTDIMR